MNNLLQKEELMQSYFSHLSSLKRKSTTIQYWNMLFPWLSGWPNFIMIQFLWVSLDYSSVLQLKQQSHESHEDC